MYKFLVFKEKNNTKNKNKPRRIGPHRLPNAAWQQWARSDSGSWNLAGSLVSTLSTVC